MSGTLRQGVLPLDATSVPRHDLCTGDICLVPDPCFLAPACLPAWVQLGQRERLLSATGRLAATSTRVGDARKMALHAEQLGVTILQDLHSQRQSLLHSHDMVGAPL